jgi:hypothetical protein
MAHPCLCRAARAALRSSCAIFLCFAACCAATRAQEASKIPSKIDNTVSIGAFGQLTNSAVVPGGNSEGASGSFGTLLSFHSSYRWDLGYDINYGYTRYSDQYSFYKTPPPAGINVATGMHELTAAYRIQGPTLPFHLASFAELGTGMLVFSPSSAIISQDPVENPFATPIPTWVKTQIRVPILFGGGVNLPLPNHFGVRLEYRGLFYPAPSFGQGSGFETKRNMITSEPALSINYKF